MEYYNKFIEEFPQYSGDDLTRRAFSTAEKCHAGQVRMSGDGYIVHPYEVVRILAALGLDNVSIAAGMLHDVCEDTSYPITALEADFGAECAKIVDGVTKLKKFDFATKEEQQAESLRKMFLAMASDIRVLIIKLADRLHNMRTLNYTNEDQQVQKSRETMEIYAPLAHRLGISSLKWELEDLALKYISPEEYLDIAAKLKQTRAQREMYIKGIITRIKDAISPIGIHFEIEGRPKSIYSIYKKMQTTGAEFEELYDLIAIRIIVDTIKDCYAVLGVVHTIWKPLPMRFKDYIASPKANMYQSLHTTLFGAEGKPFEVQIRTVDMHKTSEYGIAAHWKYKEGQTSADLDQKLSWLRELTEWQNELKDSVEFMQALKVDLFEDHVFVFTPKGGVLDFVKGATPLDFAYAIHSEIGNKCVGAKVNGKLVPLNYKLQTGDIVTINTSASHKGPSRDWLNMVATNSARNKIRQWFKREKKDENMARGKDMLEREAKHQGYDLYELTRPEWLKPLYKRLTVASLEDLFAVVGYGGLTTNQVLSRLIAAYRKEHKEEQKQQIKREKAKSNAPHSIEVAGASDMVVRLARCCNPLPGDKILGYVTRGRGVSVHRTDCPNVGTSDFISDRRVDVKWTKALDSKFAVELQIITMDTPKIWVDITMLLHNSGHSINTLNGRTLKSGDLAITLNVDIGSIGDMNTLMERIRGLSGVGEVYRVNN